jgi:hypothetical protein
MEFATDAVFAVRQKCAPTRGVRLGRPAMEFPKQWERSYTSWKNGEISPTEAAKELKLKRPTFYLMVKRWEMQTEVNLS